jgi:hypothetical protein
VRCKPPQASSRRSSVLLSSRVLPSVVQAGVRRGAQHLRWRLLRRLRRTRLPADRPDEIVSPFGDRAAGGGSRAYPGASVTLDPARRVPPSGRRPIIDAAVSGEVAFRPCCVTLEPTAPGAVLDATVPAADFAVATSARWVGRGPRPPIREPRSPRTGSERSDLAQGAASVPSAPKARPLAPPFDSDRAGDPVSAATRFVAVASERFAHAGRGQFPSDCSAQRETRSRVTGLTRPCNEGEPRTSPIHQLTRWPIGCDHAQPLSARRT